jgi:hypothetical protein
MQHVQRYSGSHWMPPLRKNLLSISLAAARAKGNKTTMTKCTNFAVHFDGEGSVPVQYRVNHSMEEVQGFGRSHLTLPLGKY